MIETRESSSFRDPSGFVFYEGKQLFRQVNRSYAEHYALLKSSGLNERLIEKRLLVPADEVAVPSHRSEALAILKPERIPFISHPFEWSFSQLQDAAILTLELQEISLSHGMVLKDASAFNVQFLNGKPIFIDSLSFEIYQEGAPWVAYRQFCRHFLAPLALMCYVDERLGRLSRVNLDGVPLDLASKMLPSLTKLKPGLLTHIHMHAKAETHKAGAGGRVGSISKTAMAALVDSLKGTVSSLHCSVAPTEWSDYYQDNNYSDEAMAAKRQMVSQAIDLIDQHAGGPQQGALCWDLGANTGEFSRIAAVKSYETIAWDMDPSAVEKNYLQVKRDGDQHVLPLIQDLTNPAPSLGWMSQERKGLLSRGPAELILALALIHHLAIGNNLPLWMIAEFLSRAGRYAIVEFVPKEDSQVKRMLSHREDIFDGYTLEGWRAAIDERFECLAEWQIPNTCRTLFVLGNRG
jgi:hypothetical protein